MARRRMYNPSDDGVTAARPEKPKKKTRSDPAVRARAEELALTGMPFQLAMAVALGRVDLNTALERMAREQQVDRMVAKHDLSRALATQIVLNQASLDVVLAQRRMVVHRETHRDRSCLDESHKTCETKAFALHGSRVIICKVLGVDSYQATIQEITVGSEPEQIHKLQFKYCFDPKDEKKVRRFIKWDQELSKSPREPIVRPQNRYSISDKRLFQFVDNGELIEITLLEGEKFKCTVSWFGRYEMGVLFKGNETPVTVFRHCLQKVQVV